MNNVKMMMREVTIYDAIMGSGKTYDAIEKMKVHKGNFIYVTPFLDEVERIIANVPNVKEPNVSYDYNELKHEYNTIYKRDNLLRMANNQDNMATTHSLFEKLHRGDYSHFVSYDLILDEVITPIKVLGITPADIKIAIDQGLIVVNKDSGEVTYTGDEYDGKFYAELKRYCDTANVIYVNDRLLVWAFPPEIFKMFKSVTVLTYLFEGSLLAAYFKYYNIPFKVKKASLKDEQDKKEEIKNLLNIYEGTANKIGNNTFAFSGNWLRNKTSAQLKQIKNATANLLSRKFKSSSSETGFTTFNEFKSKLSGQGYTKGFIPVNERATNKYSHKQTMLYLANRFIKPSIIDFFKGGKIVVDEDQWALAELLQWIFRGSIRNNEKMNLYIPSSRMRNLLKNWLYEDACISIEKAA